MRRNFALAAGIASTLAATWLWHGPGGAAGRFETSVERTMRVTLDHYEMPGIAAQLDGRPLTRQLRLAGRADDFQRGEISRIAREVPGVAGAHWSGQSVARAFPLLAEVMAMALASFAAGVVIAYIAALRRRAREAFE